jgi:hypothetical protein
MEKFLQGPLQQSSELEKPDRAGRLAEEKLKPMYEFRIQ